MYQFTDRKSWPRLKRAIYGIYCKALGKMYAGKTVCTSQRWNSHISELKRNIHANYLLQDAFNLYGIDSFYFIILEKDVSEENLIIRESFWVKYLCCMSYQGGFNLAEPDENGNRIYYGNEYELIKPDGSIIRFQNLTKFARDNNLNLTCLNRIIKGTSPIHRGYKSTNPEFHAKCIDIRIFSPTGELYIVKNNSEFEKEHGLKKGEVTDLVNGRRPHVKGWYLETASERDLKIREAYLNNLNKPKKIIEEKIIIQHRLLDADKRLYTFTVIKYFAEENNLSDTALSTVLSGKEPFHYGWHLPEPKVEFIERINKELVHFYILSPSGVVYKFNEVATFAKKHMESSFYILKRLIEGILKTFKGWRVPTEEEKTTCKVIDVRWEGMRSRG